MHFRAARDPRQPPSVTSRRNVLVVLILVNLIGTVVYFIAEERHLYGFEFDQTWANTTPFPSSEYQKDLTVDLWLRINDFPVRWNSTLIEKGSGPGKIEFSIRTKDRDTAVCSFDLGETSASLPFAYREILPEGKWVRLTAVKNTSTNEFILYADGTEIAQAKFSNVPHTQVESYDSSISIFGDNDGRLLRATLFRLAIWNRALTPKEIRRLGKAPKLLSESNGLIVQWQLDAEKQKLVPKPPVDLYRLMIETVPTEATN